MTDVVVLAREVSTPIKLAWLLWLAWSVVQIGWYRRIRVATSAASRPASRTQIDDADAVPMLGTAPSAPVEVSPSATPNTVLAVAPVAAPLAGPPAPPEVGGPQAPVRRRRRAPRSISTSKAALESLSTV